MAAQATMEPSIHIKQNSEEALASLFNRSQSQAQPPMNSRPGLPPSFFDPGPGQKPHFTDREMLQRQIFLEQQNVYLLPQQHSHSFSSPADMGEARGATQLSSSLLQQAHMRQISCGNALDDPPRQQQAKTKPGSNMDPLGPLPNGWEAALSNDNKYYFINHNMQKTQWEDPRIDQRQLFEQQQQQFEARSRQLENAKRIEERLTLLHQKKQQIAMEEASLEAELRSMNIPASSFYHMETDRDSGTDQEGRLPDDLLPLTNDNSLTWL